MTARRIVVVGSINNDLVYRVSDFPQPGETIISLESFSNPGGKGANQAIAAARAGGEVAMLACLGDDPFGLSYLDDLKKEGINTLGVSCLKGQPSGTAVIFVNHSGENEIVINAGANGLFNSDVLAQVEPGLADASWVLFQNEIPLETTLQAIRSAKAHQAGVIWNPAPISGVSMDDLDGIHILVLNETEATAIAGGDKRSDRTWAAIARPLHDAGAENVLITLGAEGVWISRPAGGALMPGFEVEPVDTTAAGDTFVGALAARLSLDETLDASVMFAQAAAALSVTRQGAQCSIPCAEEVRRAFP